jgi:hypothetical protein
LICQELIGRKSAIDRVPTIEELRKLGYFTNFENSIGGAKQCNSRNVLMSIFMSS